MLTILASFSISQSVAFCPVTSVLMMTAPVNVSWFHYLMGQSAPLIRYCCKFEAIISLECYYLKKTQPVSIIHEMQPSLAVVSKGALCVS